MTDKFECNICGKIYKTNRYYKKHLKTHNDKKVIIDENEKEIDEKIEKEIEEEIEKEKINEKINEKSQEKKLLENDNKTSLNFVEDKFDDEEIKIFEERRKSNENSGKTLIDLLTKNRNDFSEKISTSKNQKSKIKINDEKKDKLINLEIQKRKTGSNSNRIMTIDNQIKKEIQKNMDFVVNRTFENIYMGSRLLEDGINLSESKFYLDGFSEKILKDEKEYKDLIERGLFSSGWGEALMKYISKYPMLLLGYKYINDGIYSLRFKDQLDLEYEYEQNPELKEKQEKIEKNINKRIINEKEKYNERIKKINKKEPEIEKKNNKKFTWTNKLKKDLLF